MGVRVHFPVSTWLRSRKAGAQRLNHEETLDMYSKHLSVYNPIFGQTTIKIKNFNLVSYELRIQN